MLPERERRLEQTSGLSEKRLPFRLPLQLLAVETRKVRLLVKRIEVAHAATCEDLDDALDLGLVVRGAIVIVVTGACFRGIREHPGKRNRS